MALHKGLVALVVLSFVSYVEATSLTNPSDFLDSSLVSNLHLNLSEKCGEVLDEERGGIWYNYPGTPLANHRCLWVLRVENATGYNISILGFANPHNNSHQLTFTGFNYGNMSQREYHILTNNSNNFFEIRHSNIVVIALQTKENGDITTNGIVLGYNATFTDDIALPSPSSSDHIISVIRGTAGYWEFLAEPGTPVENQLTTIIFTLEDNTFDESVLTYISTSLLAPGVDCDHVMHMFKYDNESDEENPAWIEDAENTCQWEGGFSKNSNDMMLLMYWSNDVIPFSGFLLMYETIYGGGGEVTDVNDGL